jgi:phage shock protein PspC (stress-responsive transcriptional regulator)
MNAMNGKRLYKSADKKVSGVCGGVAEYLGVDPTVVRLIWACTFLFTGAGLIAYIVAALIMEENPENTYETTDFKETSSRDSGTIKGFKPEL